MDIKELATKSLDELKSIERNRSAFYQITVRDHQRAYEAEASYRRTMDDARDYLTDVRSLIAIREERGDRCPTPMQHQDGQIAQCTLDRSHALDDSDHVDEHGHTAPVLVSQATIREVEAVARARQEEQA